jgi:hypothetical protein
MHRLALLLTACTIGQDYNAPSQLGAPEACVSTECGNWCEGGNAVGDSLIAQINRTFGLRWDWEPDDLVKLPQDYKDGSGDLLRLRAATAWMRLADGAFLAGHDIYCGSSYRTFDEQCTLFDNAVQQDGCVTANTYSVPAGHSEHELGTACDVYENGQLLDENSPTKAWIDEHAWEYGFVLSFPPHSECFTESTPEPWHYRYVGVPVATFGRDTAVWFERSISATELISLYPPQQEPATYREAAVRPDDLALLCREYKVSWCAPGNRLIACEGFQHVEQCANACISSSDPTVPDHCE